MKRLAAYGEPVDGTPFGRYRLIELLGRGGMGEVWRAHDSDTDRVVAIKVLPAHFSDNEEFQRRFRREAHAAARLNSPHVIPIHNYGEIDGRLYVDMRLIEGRDLETVLADGPLPPARAVRIIEQVAKALHAAHEVGLVHRDVKPSNILLDKDDFAYLIDFGIARAMEETRLTSTGNAIGTFHYMAPERLGDHPSDDARADIYALACVLYECLTGQPPFAGASMGSLVAAHLHTPPPQPSTTQPNIPKQVDQVIATGMAKDPDQRYATTVELADAAHDAITTPLAPPSEPTLHAEQTKPTPAATLIDNPARTQRGDPPSTALQRRFKLGPTQIDNRERAGRGQRAPDNTYRHQGPAPPATPDRVTSVELPTLALARHLWTCTLSSGLLTLFVGLLMLGWPGIKSLWRHKNRCLFQFVERLPYCGRHRPGVRSVELARVRRRPGLGALHRGSDIRRRGHVHRVRLDTQVMGHRRIGLPVGGGRGWIDLPRCGRDRFHITRPAPPWAGLAHMSWCHQSDRRHYCRGRVVPVVARVQYRCRAMPLRRRGDGDRLRVRHPIGQQESGRGQGLA